MSLSPIVHWPLTDAERERIEALRQALTDLAQRTQATMAAIPKGFSFRRTAAQELTLRALRGETGAVTALGWLWLWSLSDPSSRASVGVPQTLDDDGETPLDQVDDALRRAQEAEYERLRLSAMEGSGDHVGAQLAIVTALLDGEERRR